jgi:hypothetical protein
MKASRETGRVRAMLRLRPVQGNVNTVPQSSVAAPAGVGGAIDAMDIERANDAWFDHASSVNEPVVCHVSRSGR